MRKTALLALLALLPGCPDPDPMSDDEGSTDTTGDSTTDSTDSTGDSTGDSTTGEPDMNHGTVKLEIAADDPMNPPFATTTQILATVEYTDCLQQFYLSGHPELQQADPNGAAVFSEWIDRLCDPTLEKVIPCQVTSIEQTLIPDVAVYTLRVTFEITDPTAIEDNWLYIGPLPNAEFVADVCDTPPRVEVRANGLVGRDAGDAQQWGIKTLPANNQATTDQATPLRITVGI